MSTEERCTITFAGPDILVSMFEHSVIIASSNALTEDTLISAASKLLRSWPMLSYRVGLTRKYAKESATSSVNDGFLYVKTFDKSILPDFRDSKPSDTIQIHDPCILNDMFSARPRTLIDRLRPRVFAIEAALMKDTTLFKFTMQHVAGDAVGLYNAVVAFCEGLHGSVTARSSRSLVDYKVVQGCRIKQQQALPAIEHLRSHTRCRLFSTILTGAKKWIKYWTVATRWQTIYIPEDTLSTLRSMAKNASVKVSTFDLFTSWVHMHLEDFAVDMSPNRTARLAFTMNMKANLHNPQEQIAECWNPLVIVSAPDYPRGSGIAQIRLVQGAINIRTLINRTRESQIEGMALAAQIEEAAEGRQGRSLLLTSWSHAPFPQLQMGAESRDLCEPILVQPMLNCLKSLPVPRGQAREIGICWKGTNGGYWFTANLEHDLWRRMEQSSHY